MRDRVWIRVDLNQVSGCYGLSIVRRVDNKKEALTEAGWVPLVESTWDRPVVQWIAEEQPDPLRELAANLHHLGLTPATDAIGELKATDKHLQDMRALVFKSGKP